MGIDCVNFSLNVLEVIPQEQVLDSLRVFGREVMPQFKDERRKSEDDAPKPLSRQSAAAGGR